MCDDAPNNLQEDQAVADTRSMSNTNLVAMLIAVGGGILLLLGWLFYPNW